MARVVFASAAYVGDVAPFVGPANALADRGHDVVFLTPAGFHPLLAGERFGLARYPLDFSPTGLRADPRHERLMRHPWVNQLRLGRYWMRRGFVADPGSAREALLATLRGADVLVSHPTFGSATVPVARHLGIPTVVGQLFPMMMPTADWAPPVGVSNPTGPRRANELSWKAFARLSGMVMYDRAMNRHRRALGRQRLAGNALLAWTEADRTVVLASRHYFGPEPSDWTSWRLEGFSPWAGPAGREVDPAVERFLEDGDGDGDQPVLVCLGTSAAAGAAEAFARIGGDLRRRRLRSLLLVADRANLARLNGEPGAFEFVPVPSVIGRCRAAVVSGALGTLAAALMAGVPVVVLPQLFDQLWHGHRVEQLGVGKMVTRPSAVGAAVSEVVEDPGYRTRARALAEAMASEDGGAALVRAVEETL